MWSSKQKSFSFLSQNWNWVAIFIYLSLFLRLDEPCRGFLEAAGGGHDEPLSPLEAAQFWGPLKEGQNQSSLGWVIKMPHYLCHRAFKIPRSRKQQKIFICFLYYFSSLGSLLDSPDLCKSRLLIEGKRFGRIILRDEKQHLESVTWAALRRWKPEIPSDHDWLCELSAMRLIKKLNNDTHRRKQRQWHMATLERGTFLEAAFPPTWSRISYRKMNLLTYSLLPSYVYHKKALPFQFTHLQLSSAGNPEQLEKQSPVSVIHTDVETPHRMYNKSVQSAECQPLVRKRGGGNEHEKWVFS